MKLAAALAALLLLAAALAAQDISHIVVVVLDDVGTDKIDCYGHPTAGPTPVIDNLAANGLRFTRAYANPTCSPTRAAALTGLYGSRTGVETGMPHYNRDTNPNGDFAPSDELPWLPRLLFDEGGLRSFAVGKWHLTHIDVDDFHEHPLRVGFTWHRGHMANIPHGMGQTEYSWAKNIASENGWSEPTVTTYVTTDNMVEAWNALHGSVGQRSFVWLALNAPHPPWDSTPPSGTFTPVGGTQTEPLKQQYVLQSADTLLGQLMSFYASQHPTDASETLWLVMGDNGTPAAAVEQLPGHQVKATAYEGGVHVPLIAYGAGVADPGRETDNIVHAVDLWATVMELFGVEVPCCAETDSRSFAAVLFDAEAEPARTIAYVRHAQPNGFGAKDWREHAAIEARWKMREYDEGSTHVVQLFDLDNDPTELTNLMPANTSEESAAVALLQPVLDDGDEDDP